MGTHNEYIILVTSQLAATAILVTCGFIFRFVRRYLTGLRHAQADISTIWVQLGLPRSLRSGSYRYPREGENDSV